jgi:hypothetical protein
MTADIKKTNTGRIEVLHHTEIIIDAYLYILYNANSGWDYFADVRSLSVVPLGFEAVKKAILEAGAVPLAVVAAKERAAKVRILFPCNKEVEDILKQDVEEEPG